MPAIRSMPLARLRAELLIPLIATAMLIALWTNAFVHVDRERRHAVDAALGRSAAWAARLSERVDRLLRQADVATRLVAHLYERTTALDVPVAINQQLLPRDIEASISIADAHGDVVASSRGLDKGINVADRESFKVHLAGNGDALHVGVPVQSRIVQRWTVPLSRAVRDRAGRFLGSVAVMIDPQAWTDGFDAAELGADAVLAIIGADGIYRARRVGDTVGFGERVDLRHLGALARRSQAGREALISPLGGVPRFMAYRKLDSYPVFVGVGIAQEAALGEYRAWHAQYMRMMALWTTATIAVAAMLTIQVHRLRRSHREAEAARHDYHAASEVSLDAFFLLREVRAPSGDVVDFVCHDLNARGAALLGAPKEALKGRRLTEVMPASRPSGFLERCVEVARSGQPFEQELRIPLPRRADPWMHAYVASMGRGVAITLRDVTERKRAERARERDRSFLQAILEHLPVAVCAKSMRPENQGRYLFSNRAALRIFGVSHQHMVGATTGDVFAAPARACFEAQDQHVVARRAETFFPEQRYDGPQGRRHSLNMTKVPVFDSAGRIDYLLCITEDVTDRHAALEQLRMAQQVLQQTEEALIVTDERDTVLMTNPAFCRLSGFPEDQVIGRPASQVGVIRLDEWLPAGFGAHDQARWAGESTQRTRDGRELPCWLSVSTWRSASDGRITIRLWSDISSLKAAQARLEDMALYDSLTGLPNRAHFHLRLEQAIERARRTQQPMAVFFLDLDNFKTVNDTLGHEAGDALLQAVAARLGACARASDTVSRLGGDEFTVIAEGLRMPDDAIALCERLTQALARPVPLAGTEVQVSGSVGICAYPQDGQTVTDLLRNADLAMYHVKELGKNGHHFFSSELAESAAARMGVEQNLRRALRDGELCLLYQPKVELASGETVGLEALVRWNPPGRGTLGPGEFIPVAERSDLILELDEWVIDAACRQIRAWRDAGLATCPVAVNVSTRQLARGNLDHCLRQALDRYRLGPEALQVELTETAMLTDAPAARALLRKLQTLGVRIAIDDFGTGGSTLARLLELPAYALKIDRSLLVAADAGESSRAVFETAVQLAKRLGFRAIVEGVETEAQRLLACRSGCDEAQGYLLGRPAVPEEAATRFEAAQAPGARAPAQVMPA